MLLWYVYDTGLDVEGGNGRGEGDSSSLCGVSGERNLQETSEFMACKQVAMCASFS